MTHDPHKGYDAATAYIATHRALGGYRAQILVDVLHSDICHGACHEREETFLLWESDPLPLADANRAAVTELRRRLMAGAFV